MATLIEAINAYGPRIKRGRRAEMKQLVTFISGRTGLNKGDIQHVLSELKETVQFFNLAGQSVKLEGLGCFRPTISLDGTFSIIHVADSELKAELNKLNAFVGELENSDMIGKTSTELAERWNEEHPADLIVLT